MEPPQQIKLSRLVSHALRHEPDNHGLHPDDEGWVPVAELLRAVRDTGGSMADVAIGDLAEMIAGSEKRRHELNGSCIRALYGHSIPGRVLKPVAEPPNTLFHGTSSRAWIEIRRGGLKPMHRQYVHLSVDRRTAELVGARKGSDVVVISVHALKASRSGVVFRIGNDQVWLADPISAKYLSIDAAGPA